MVIRYLDEMRFDRMVLKKRRRIPRVHVSKLITNNEYPITTNWVILFPFG